MAGPPTAFLQRDWWAADAPRTSRRQDPRPARQVLPGGHRTGVRQERPGRSCHPGTTRAFVAPLSSCAPQAVT